MTGATGNQVQPFPGQVGQHLTGATGNQGQPFPGQVGQVQLGAAAQPIQAVNFPSYTGDTRSQQVITATGYQLGQVQGGAAHPLPAQGHPQPAIGAFPGQATRPLVAQRLQQPAIRVGQVVHSDSPLLALPQGTYSPSSQVAAQQVQSVQAQNAAPVYPQGQVLSVGIQQHQPVPLQGLHQGLSQQAQLQGSQPYHTGHQVQQVGHQTIQPQSAGQPTPCQGSQHIRGIHHVQHPPYQPVHPYQPGQDLMQQVQYKLEYRCSPTSGKVFQVYVPIQPCHVQHTPIHYEWRCDPRTGETYQVPVKNLSEATPQPNQQISSLPVAPLPPVQQPTHYPWSNQSPVEQSAEQQQQLHLQSVQQVEGHDRNRGILELTDRGAIKKSKVIDFARKCPVKWAKLAKPENVNLPLYSYGAVTELEAALSGRGDPISHEVLLAKIRHLKNTFEVCCLNSTQYDFSAYGWTIARDYARNSVKRKEDPTNLPSTTKKDRCTTFNTCTTEMKCSYEVSNPGRTCVKKHECSWCRTNLQQSYKHQEWKCQKKQAAGQ